MPLVRAKRRAAGEDYKRHAAGDRPHVSSDCHPNPAERILRSGGNGTTLSDNINKQWHAAAGGIASDGRC